jgi:two-component system, NarL family, response regulator DevR
MPVNPSPSRTAGSVARHPASLGLPGSAAGARSASGSERAGSGAERDAPGPASPADAGARPESHPLRVLVVDDHDVVRQGLVALLARRPEFQVVAQAGTVAGAIVEARRYEPELVLMDVSLPDGSGVDACRAIRAELPGTRVVFLTSSPEEEDVFAAIVAGATGYVLKQSRAAELVKALAAAGRGESLLDPAVTGAVVGQIRRIATDGYVDAAQPLTEQERKILALLATGGTNKEIAAQVFLSDKTVKNYVSSILSKLDLERRSQVPAFVEGHRHELRHLRPRDPANR